VSKEVEDVFSKEDFVGVAVDDLCDEPDDDWDVGDVVDKVDIDDEKEKDEGTYICFISSKNISFVNNVSVILQA
jgi:hypothetical protein